MNIENKVLKQLGCSQYKALKEFYSRRNKVYLISGQPAHGPEIEFIYKEYIYGDIDREYDYLRRLSGLPVPAVLARGDNALALGYICGKTMLERLEQGENTGEPLDGCIDAFLDFLEQFYTALPGHIYGDVNFRNFINTEKGVCGVDLEEAGPGSIEADIGRAAAFMLTYNPSGTDYKIKNSGYLIEKGAVRFCLKKHRIVSAAEAELDAMRVRRGNNAGGIKNKHQL